MGMFDEIVVKDDAWLPDPPHWVRPGHVFQTKDLGGSQLRYDIRRDGALRFAHVQRSITRGRKPGDFKPFTGTLRFYTSCDATNDWYEVEATFADGYLQARARVE